MLQRAYLHGIGQLALHELALVHLLVQRACMKRTASVAAHRASLNPLRACRHTDFWQCAPASMPVQRGCRVTPNFACPDVCMMRDEVIHGAPVVRSLYVVQGSFCPSRHTRAIACGAMHCWFPRRSCSHACSKEEACTIDFKGGHAVRHFLNQKPETVLVKRTCASMAGFLQHSKHAHQRDAAIRRSQSCWMKCSKSCLQQHGLLIRVKPWACTSLSRAG